MSPMSVSVPGAISKRNTPPRCFYLTRHFVGLDHVSAPQELKKSKRAS